MKKRISIFIMIFLIVFMSVVTPVFAIDDYFPEVTTMVKVAMGAAALLVASTVFQVGDLVGATVDATGEIARSVYASMQDDIQSWWDSLSVSDQQAYADKVHSDDNLTISEALPSTLISAIIAESVGYTGSVVIDNYAESYNFNELGIVTKSIEGAQNGWDYVFIELIASVDYYNYKYYDGAVSFLSCAPVGTVIFRKSDFFTSFNSSNYSYWESYNSRSGARDEMFFYNELYKEYAFTQSVHLIEATALEIMNEYDLGNFDYTAPYYPDNQQALPFYYPVDSLSLTSTVDTSIMTDSQVSDIDTYIPYVSSETWDYTAGSTADTSIPLAYDGTTLSDADTGIPVSLGVDAPWTNDTTVDDASVSVPGDIVVDDTFPATATIDFAPLSGMTDIFTKFPFSLPYDIVAIVQSFVTDRTIPSYSWSLPALPGQVAASMDISLAPLDPMFNVLRPLMLLFMIVRMYFFLARRSEDKDNA